MLSVEIPLQPRPERFSVTLLGASYVFQTFWIDPAGCWGLNIEDVNGDALVNGLALITGADLLDQFEYLGIGGQLWVVPTLPSAVGVPGFDDLGINWNLVFLTP